MVFSNVCMMLISSDPFSIALAASVMPLISQLWTRYTVDTKLIYRDTQWNKLYNQHYHGICEDMLMNDKQDAAGWRIIDGG